MRELFGALRLLARWLWRKPCPVCEEPRWATTRLGLYERVRPGCPVWFHRQDRARWTVGARRYPTSRKAGRVPPCRRCHRATCICPEGRLLTRPVQEAGVDAGPQCLNWDDRRAGPDPDGYWRCGDCPACREVAGIQ